MSIVNTKEIKRRREAKLLTLDAAARKAGWKSSMQWWDVESGKRANPTVGTMATVASVLECTIDDLLMGANTPKSSYRTEAKRTRKL